MLVIVTEKLQISNNTETCKFVKLTHKNNLYNSIKEINCVFAQKCGYIIMHISQKQVLFTFDNSQKQVYNSTRQTKGPKNILMFVKKETNLC